MNRSYAKLRHIKEANILLEERLSNKKINEQPMPNGKKGQTLSTAKNTGVKSFTYKGQKLKVNSCSKSIKVNGKPCTKDMIITGTDVITGNNNDQINFQDIKGFGALQATISGGMLTYSIIAD
jgi:hypothetical protein